MIRLNDKQYWLYAAVDPGINELLHTNLEPTRKSVIAHPFFRKLREKHDIDDAAFFVDGATPLKDACLATASILDTNATEIETALKVFLLDKV